MSAASRREIYFSFFMFTADLRPEDANYTQVLVDHLKALTDMGYDGFDMHIASRPENVDHKREVKSYVVLKKAFDAAGLKIVFRLSDPGGAVGAVHVVHGGGDAGRRFYS